MDSLKELFKIGNGPSSSHTMGPEKAAKIFKEKNPQARKFAVELYGSLALTGKGHLTDWIIEKTLAPIETEIIWCPEINPEFHPNGLKFMAYDSENQLTDQWTVYSVGGGTIVGDGTKLDQSPKKPVYPLQKLTEIKKWCNDNDKYLWQYVEECEGKEIWVHIRKVWHTMESSVRRGLNTEGLLPGTLKYPRKAKQFYEQAEEKPLDQQFLGRLFAYTLAVSEENAAGGLVVTAPTCGASGVVPGVLYALRAEYEIEEEDILHSLAVAGLIGNIIKHNATISGAEGGCQAEVGAACSMAAAMATYLLGGNRKHVEYAAEIALEHNLGLTCDPVSGYVQIPCIERNAIAATRAMDTARYALYTDGNHAVPFDQVVITMKKTGEDLRSEYKETSLGGLAKFYFDATC